MKTAITMALLSGAFLFVGCAHTPTAPEPENTIYGVSRDLPEGSTVPSGNYTSRVVLDGLNNPSSVSIRGDRLVVCEAGSESGQVHMIDPKGRDVLDGFTTEYWKTDAASGKESFKVGPLSAIHLSEDYLLVSNGGLKDGEETLVKLHVNGGGTSSNAVGFQSEDDPGEGNFVGLVKDPSGNNVYVCGQGSDAKTWILKYEIATNTLVRAFSADAHGIDVNSPMQCRMLDDEQLLVLYSGAGGVEDGRIVLWNTSTGTPVSQWSLPGIADPMGMDFVPGRKDELMIVDNNWSMDRVNTGGLYSVILGDSEEAKVMALKGPALKGPVSCVFGEDGKLYVAELGSKIDSSAGRVVAISIN